MTDLDSLIDQRNAVQLRAENMGHDTGTTCWARLGVANRHISRVCEGRLDLAPAVEREIVDCISRASEWLDELERRVSGKAESEKVQ